MASGQILVAAGVWPGQMSVALVMGPGQVSAAVLLRLDGMSASSADARNQTWGGPARAHEVPSRCALAVARGAMSQREGNWAYYWAASWKAL
jgi:hypothetical protein